MISEKELRSAQISVDQYIRDLELSRERDKHDPTRLKETSHQLSIAKTKLQILHWAEGVIAPINDEVLEATRLELESRIAQLEEPREMDLFDNDALKRADLELGVLKTKLGVLRFLAGQEKRVI